MMVRKIIFVFLLCLFFCQSVYAAGVTPSSYAFDFEPGLEKDVSFNFIFGKDAELEVYADGDLAEYVEIDKDSLLGGGVVSVHLKLPSEIEIPGVHRILVGAKQIPNEEGGMGIVANVQGVIKIRVPYPGKYAEIGFTAGNVNAGEPVELKLSVSNLGKEEIFIEPVIKVFDSEKKIEEWALESQWLSPTKSVAFSRVMDTQNYNPGDYNATAVVEYGGKRAAVANLTFRLGELYVAVSNTSNYFERGKINRFEIEAESFWNDPIENLFAEVLIEEYDISFLTPSTNLNPWDKTTLVGFFNTEDIEKEEFQAEIILNYEGTTTSKTVTLFLKEEFDYVMYVMIGGLVLVIIILVIIIVLLRKNGKKKK